MVNLLLFLAMAAQDTRLVVILVGAPGSGKTTQARNIKSKYRIPAISMSDILKKAGGGRKSGLNRQLKVQVASGDLVGDEGSNLLIQERISRKDALRGFVLDGYPMNDIQAQYLEDHLKEKGLPAPVVIHLAIPDAVALQRMSVRGRADDKPEVMKRRMEDYHRESEAVLARYKGKQLKTIDATGRPEDIWRAVERALEEK